MRGISIGVSVVLVGLVSAYVVVLQPYMDYEYVRNADRPVTIEVEYENRTGDPLCTKLYRVRDGEATDEGVFPRLPSDLPDPHDSSDLEDRDRVLLTGYTYDWVERNRITGVTHRRPTEVIDVIAWQEVGAASYASKQPNLQPADFAEENYTDCKP